MGKACFVLTCRLCNLALQLEGADSASSPAAAGGTSSSLASVASCLLTQMVESNQVVMVVSSAVFGWLLGAAEPWPTPGDASPRPPRDPPEALHITAFAAAFSPSPELVRLQFLS
jgi:hypothetical protein